MKIIITAFVIWMLLNAASSIAQPGTLDSTFSKDGKVFTSIGGFYDGAKAIAIQKDGKIVVAGSGFMLARYKPNGSLDISFGDSGIVPTPLMFFVNALAIQQDGKIVVAGSSNNYFALARFNYNGTIDSTFGKNGIIITDFGGETNQTDAANAVALQKDGKIIAAGHTFIKPSGSLYIVMAFALVRYNSDGKPDNSFGNNGKVITRFATNDMNSDYCRSVLIQPDGKILAAGNSGGGPFLQFAVARYKKNGTPDSSFGINGLVITNNGFSHNRVYSMALDTDGKIVLAGGGSKIGEFSYVVMKFKKNGLLDSSFGTNGMFFSRFYGGHDEARAVAIQTDKKIVLAGIAGNDAWGAFGLMRLTSKGEIDDSFGTNGIVLTHFNDTTQANAMALQQDGKIVAAGTIRKNGIGKIVVARYTGDKTCINGQVKNDLASFQKDDKQFTSSSTMYISPNPGTDIIHINGLTASIIKTVSIMDVNGKVLQQVFNATSSSFNVKQLPAGIYFVKINDQEKTTTLKFMKE